MSRKKLVGIIAGVIILLVIASQIVLIRMVYAHQVEGNAAYWLAKIYDLKAGTIESQSQKLALPLDEYFQNKFFVRNFLIKNIDQNMSEEEIDAAVWNKVMKNTWLRGIARQNNIEVTADEVQYHLDNISDPADLQKAQEQLGMNLVEYKTLVIAPFILESKVYEFLIDNYNDIEGVNRAQQAFDKLEAGEDFMAVAQEFSDDPLSYEQSVLVPEAELLDYYEPIAQLQPGQHSKIVKVPGAYIIWNLESVYDDEAEKIYEIKGIFMIAKTVEEFFQEFIAASEVKRTY